MVLFCICIFAFHELIVPSLTNSFYLVFLSKSPISVRVSISLNGVSIIPEAQKLLPPSSPHSDSDSSSCGSPRLHVSSPHPLLSPLPVFPNLLTGPLPSGSSCPLAALHPDWSLKMQGLSCPPYCKPLLLVEVKARILYSADKVYVIWPCLLFQPLLQQKRSRGLGSAP